jgi:DNA repair protein RecO (recombination protein O)
MPASQITPALVLRTRPFGESDKIVSLLTQNLGKITGIAKGAKRSRRRFANSLEPFSLVHLQVQDHPNRSLAFIVSAELLLSFTRVVSSLTKISYASYMVEITEGLIAEREENLLIFNHLRDALSYLDQAEPSLRFLTSFELILLSLAGYQPFFDRCKYCGNGRHQSTPQWYFSFQDGGIFCDGCARTKKETLPVSAPALAVLRHLQGKRSLLTSSMSLPSSVISEIRFLVSQLIQFHMEREIKSVPFLRQFASI